MQNAKPYPTARSPWMFLGAEIEAMIASHGGGEITSSQVAALMTVAIEPQTLTVANADEQARPLADAYAAALLANAVLSAKIFQHVQSKWHNPSPSHSDLVWRFIATHSWSPRVRDSGKLTLEILAKDQFDDEQLSRAIQKWCGKTVDARTVKTVRKRMPLPKNNLCLTNSLREALNYLRKRGLCQHW